jgi:hypothetical protein
MDTALAGAKLASAWLSLGIFGGILGAWYFGGQLIALLVSVGISFYITSDSRSRSVREQAKGIVVACWACVGIIALSLFSYIPSLLVGMNVIWIGIWSLGILSGLAPIFMLIYYSTTFKRSAFSTQEWNQLGGALAGIKQSVDAMPVPQSMPAASATVMDAPGGAPAWGHTVMEEPAQSTFASLRVVQGSGVGRMYDLKASGETRIGRDAAMNDIIIDDPKISGQHAKIRVESGKMTIFDLGSSNGTMVNGTKINGSVPLQNQDKVGFGANTAVVVQIAEA